MKSNSTRDQLQALLQQLLEFRLALFIVLVAVVYLFIIWRVDILSKAQPAATTIAQQSHASTTPSIDPATVSKIRQLQNNSVNVQALFNQAREDPFQE